MRLHVSSGEIPSGRASLAALYEEFVTSSRWKDIRYRVRLLPGGIWECDCPAAGYGSRMDGECKHIDQVRERHERARSLAGLLAACRNEHGSGTYPAVRALRLGVPAAD